MPDQTTPEDHLNDRPANDSPAAGPEESPWVEEFAAPDSDAEPAELNAADREEVAAFRASLDSDSAETVSPGQQGEDLAELAERLKTQRNQLAVLPPGPGLPEAIGWTIGVIAVHTIGGVVGLLAIVVSQVMRSLTPETQPTPELVQSVLKSIPQLLDTYMLELMIVEMGIFFVAAVLATRLRLGSRVAQLIAIKPLATNHALLIMAVSIPVALMCGGFHQITLGVWNEHLAHLPGMNFFSNLNVNESIKPLGETAPFGLLLLLVAVAPAISEEIIFRGVIGRGLIARWGILPGVILTSIMFGLVHMHPAHVVALMPLAFLLHLTYLATRSILAPMLLHFLNNSLAVVLLKASTAVPALEGASEPAMPWYVLLISAAIVGLVAWTLWRSRVEYQTEDGQPWSPGYTSLEMPPESAGAVLTAAQCPLGLRRGAMGLAGAYSLVFVVSLVLMLTGHISA